MFDLARLENFGISEEGFRKLNEFAEYFDNFAELFEFLFSINELEPEERMAGVIGFIIALFLTLADE